MPPLSWGKYDFRGERIPQCVYFGRYQSDQMPPNQGIKAAGELGRRERGGIWWLSNLDDVSSLQIYMDPSRPHPPPRNRFSGNAPRWCRCLARVRDTVLCNKGLHFPSRGDHFPDWRTCLFPTLQLCKRVSCQSSQCLSASDKLYFTGNRS